MNNKDNQRSPKLLHQHVMRQSNSYLRLYRVIAIIGLAIALSLPLVAYAQALTHRPAPTPTSRPLFQGVDYERDVLQQPRPVIIHRVTLDLTTPGLRPLVTPGQPARDGTVIAAQTTSEFLDAFGLQLAINANFFAPFKENTPWSYSPRSGDRVRVLGLAMSDGVPYTEPQEGRDPVCFLETGVALGERGHCPAGTRQAIAGRELLMREGQVPLKRLRRFDNRPYARVAIALNSSQNKVWLIVVDGKQPFYSEGLTPAELAQYIQTTTTADAAINLDGGGSTTLAISTPSGPAVLNAPIHTKIPMRERPVANHLGFYARSLP